MTVLNVKKAVLSGKTREKTSCVHESVSNYSAQLIHSLNVGFIVQNYARFITTLLPPLTRLFSSSIPEKYVTHQSKSEKYIYIFCTFIFVLNTCEDFKDYRNYSNNTKNWVFVKCYFFYVKQQKHCHHIVLCATVCHMDVEKWRATFFRSESSRNIAVFFFTLASLVVRRE